MARKKAAPRWSFTYNDKDYILDVGRDLTFARLRQIKQWFPNLGTLNQMIVGLASGDGEAWACAVWAARKGADETDVTEPNRMRDFSVWELMADDEVDEVDDDDEAAVPGERPTSSPTSASTKTSTGSEGGTSDS